jgi:hypothetical protein
MRVNVVQIYNRTYRYRYYNRCHDTAVNESTSLWNNIYECARGGLVRSHQRPI